MNRWPHLRGLRQLICQSCERGRCTATLLSISDIEPEPKHEGRLNSRVGTSFTHLKGETLHGLHVILTLLLIEFAFLLGGGILVLLVLGNQIVHVGFGFGEFHLVHTLTGVPVEERLAAEHASEVLSDTLEHFLDSSRVTQETDSHLETLRRDIANRGLNVVWNPLNKVGAVLVLHVEHLLIDFLSGHASTEQSAGCQVATVT